MFTESGYFTSVFHVSFRLVKQVSGQPKQSELDTGVYNPISVAVRHARHNGLPSSHGKP